MKRLPQLDDGHLRGALGDFEHPGELLALDGVQLTAQRHLVRFRQCWIGLVGLVLLLPLFQRPVVSLAGSPSSLGEVGRLHVVWVESNAVGDQHWAASTAAFTPSRSFWFCANGHRRAGR
nr:hypothetical protein [Chthonomonas calidirosea]